MALALIACEFGFRAILFSDSKAFEHLRKPGEYASWKNEDDYWKLNYRFEAKYPPPKNPHKLLGWIGKFNRETLLHNETKNVGSRRSVLLYGDSFAKCVGRCFQDFLNNDPAFSTDNYLLNYGVGGYGVDQIALLYENTIDKYKDPFVVFSLMNYDLDRSILSVRTGQKPYYEVRNDSLILSGMPINPNPENFFKENPIRFKSFLFRKFLYGKMNLLPKKITAYFKDEAKNREKKKKVNSMILKEVVEDLRKRKIDFVFLVFHYIRPERGEFHIDHNGWRDIFIRDFLDKNQVPYIWSKDILRQDTTFSEYDTKKYMIPGNGHPTSHLNKLISNEIKRVVVNSSN